MDFFLYNIFLFGMTSHSRSKSNSPYSSCVRICISICFSRTSVNRRMERSVRFNYQCYDCCCVASAATALICRATVLTFNAITKIEFNNSHNVFHQCKHIHNAATTIVKWGKCIKKNLKFVYPFKYQTPFFHLASPSLSLFLQRICFSYVDANNTQRKYKPTTIKHNVDIQTHTHLHIHIHTYKHTVFGDGADEKQTLNKLAWQSRQKRFPADNFAEWNNGHPLGLRTVHAYVLVYDMGNLETFQVGQPNLPLWKQLLICLSSVYMCVFVRFPCLPTVLPLHQRSNLGQFQSS